MERRTVLRGALRGTAVAIALPTLESMLDTSGTAYAAGGAIPKRFGLFWWGNGVRLDRWVPSGEGTDWKLSPELEPFVNVKEYLTIVSGMRCPSSQNIVHFTGTMQMTSGIDQGATGYGPTVGSTVDQMCAERWAGQTPFRSLEINCSYDHNGPTHQKISVKNGASVPSETNPGRVFDRLFGGGNPMPGGTTTVDPAKAKAARQSVLDHVKADATRLEKRLGASDRRRLAEHLEGIRAIEMRLQTAPAVAACGTPTRPSVTLGGEPSINVEGVARAMADLTVMAMACDKARAFSFAFSGTQTDAIFSQIGLRERYHDISHRGDSGSLDACHRATVWAMKHFAYLGEKLKSTPEGAGNLLDSVCFYGSSDVAEGGSHSVSNMPIVILGKAGGKLRSGVHYRSRSGESTNKVLLSILQAVDLPISEIGRNQTRNTATLPAILA